ncbi:MAG: amidohydrolase family protein [Candidatus Doudnabacteria bacterium]|nr:amidohydrolase family protein [Candidatus Doudnabacteria bacterium]
MYSVVIKNGSILDGTGKLAYRADIAVEKRKIVEISPSIPAAKAQQVIDAKDKFVAPGFIDIQNHSDSYWTLFDQPDQKSMLAQGITTIIVGNCGASLAPLPTQEAIKAVQKWHDLSGVNLNWVTFAEFVASLSQKKLGVNVGSLAGHATIRRGLLADQIRAVTADEIKIMEDILRKSLEEGAFGFSLGLIYAHEVNSSQEELAALTRVLKVHGRYLTVHLRSEASHILEALDEVIELAKSSEVPLKISHLKIRGQKNWHLFDRVMSKLEIAYHQGLDLSFDVYPYDTSWSVLYTYLPKWAYDGGRTQILRRINQPAERRKILDYLRAAEENLGEIVIAMAQHNPGFIGKTIAQIAANQAVSNEEAVLNVLSACETQAIVFDHNLSAQQVELLTFSPLSLVATDGAGYSKETESLVHPRCFGTMPRFLRMVREKRTINWESAIRKLTSEPARILGISDRGKVSKNHFADLVIFDPKKITDRATYEHPFIYPDGMEQVLVNGQLAYMSQNVAGHFGAVIKR